MKDLEEKELNGEATPNDVESPVKPADEVNGEQSAGKSDATAEEQDGVPPSSMTDGDPDVEATTNNSLQVKALCDIAHGALGQVKAKVEVCKDESIGKGFSQHVSSYGLLKVMFLLPLELKLFFFILFFFIK